MIAEDDEGTTLGLLAIRPDTEYFTNAPRAYLELLVVSEAAEGQGAGRALMDWATSWAPSHGFTAIALDVFASNDRARRFYQRAGYADDLVRMVRDLNPENS